MEEKTRLYEEVQGTREGEDEARRKPEGNKKTTRQTKFRQTQIRKVTFLIRRK